MGRIPESVIDEILQRADIVDVVGSYVSLKRVGSGYKGLCPFHADKNPSFSVNPNKNYCKCFSCSKGGNAIGFIMEIEGLDFPSAARFLAEKYHVDIPDDGVSEQDEKRLEERKIVLKALAEAEEYYRTAFNSEEGKSARDYAQKRCLDKETVEHFGLGYSPNEWEGLHSVLKGKGFNDEVLLKSGIFVKSQKTGKLVDLFRGRLMFPIFDPMGTIIGFGGRALGDEMPKYINSPDSLVFNKKDNLYAYNYARKEKSQQLIIVEGYMDAIAMHRAGVRNTVATLGVAFTEQHLRLCMKNYEEVVFFFDADGAGQKAAMRSIEMMFSYFRKVSGKQIRIKIAKVPDGKDPDGFIKANGAEAFREIVKRAQNVEDYLHDRAYYDNISDENIFDKAKYQDDVIRYGSWISDDIKRSIIANKAGVVLGVNGNIVYNQMTMKFKNGDSTEMNYTRTAEKVRRDAHKERVNSIPADCAESLAYDGNVDLGADISNGTAVNDRASGDEIKLFAYALSLGELLTDERYVSRADIFRPGDFSGDTMRKLTEIFFNLYDPKTGVSFARMCDFFKYFTINGSDSEMVISDAYDLALRDVNVTVKRDMYLKLLFKIRIAICDNEARAIAYKCDFANDEERAILDALLLKLEARKADMVKASEAI